MSEEGVPKERKDCLKCRAVQGHRRIGSGIDIDFDTGIPSLVYVYHCDKCGSVSEEIFNGHKIVWFRKREFVRQKKESKKDVPTS